MTNGIVVNLFTSPHSARVTSVNFLLQTSNYQAETLLPECSYFGGFMECPHSMLIVLLPVSHSTLIELEFPVVVRYQGTEWAGGDFNLVPACDDEVSCGVGVNSDKKLWTVKVKAAPQTANATRS